MSKHEILCWNKAVFMYEGHEVAESWDDLKFKQQLEWYDRAAREMEQGGVRWTKTAGNTTTTTA